MDMEELRRFFAAIQPSAGHRCLASPIGPPGKDGKPTWVHWFSPGIDGLLQTYEHHDKLRLFHSVNTFSEPRRLKKSVLLHKCTYLEIDFDVPERPKPGSYKKMEQLLTALKPFEEEIGQQALIIGSGGGAHVYYPYDGAVENRAWWSDTHYLLGLCQQYGIKGIDRGPSRDASRVLRTPGATNEKYNKTVNIVQWNDKFRTPVFTPQIAIDLETNDRELQDRRYRHLKPTDVISLCGQVKRLQSSPIDVSYNEWIGILSALRRIPGGYEFALECARKDPRYQDDEYVIEKMDSLTGKDAQSCQAFLDLNPTSSPCLQCPFRTSGLNPLRAALRSIQQILPIVEPEDMPLPPEYSFEGQRIRVNGKDPTNKKDLGAIVSYTPYYVKGLYEDPVTREQTILFGFQRALSKDWDEISVPQSKCLVNGGSAELAKRINLNARVTHQYVNSALDLYETTCRQRGESTMLPIAKQAGWIWIKEHGFKFMYGKRILDESGLFRETATVEGDNRWQEVVKSLAPITNDPHKEDMRFQDWQNLAFEYVHDETVPKACKIVFLMSFVAPVIRLCVEGYRIGGAVVNVYSSTSTGKTTALRAAASIWGKPGVGDDYGLIPGINTSEAAAYHNFGLYPHLPCYVDEFTNSKMFYNAQSVHDFIKAFADGNTPVRQNQDGTQRINKKWNTICLVTSNERIVSVLRTMAGQNDSEAAEMRIIELEAPGPVPYSTKYDAFSNLYGLAGPRWIKHLCSKDVQARLHKWCQEHLEDTLPPKARYIRKVIALAEWTARELWTWRGQNEVEDWCARIVPFDRGLIEWFRESQVTSVRESTRVRQLSNMEVCVLQFLHQERANLIAYESAPCGDVARMQAAEIRARFTPKDKAGHLVYERGTVSHAWVEDEGMYYIPHTALKALHEYRVKTRSFTADMDRMVKAHDLKKRKLKLGGMVQIDRPETSCYGFSRQLIEVWQGLDSGTSED